MNIPHQPIRAVAGLGCALLLAACGGGSGGAGPDAGSGALSIYITDAPVDSVEEVWVQFSGVQVKPRSGPALDFSFDDPITLDLLALQGENHAPLLVDAELPAGEYNWIALAVNADFDSQLDSYVVTDTGAHVELRVPSGSQSGLRLVSGFTITANRNTSFMIDWDLRRALIKAPGQPGYLLRPALRITDLTEYGSIAGSVDDALLMDAGCRNDLATDQGNLVYVYEGADVEPTDIADAYTGPLATARVAQDDQAAGAYTYSVPFLSPGDYTVAFTCQGLEDDPEATDDLVFVQPQNATVVNAQTTEVDFVSE
ncbi:MAG: DUF4382 domain-containing protein [Pseudomonadales bacterium]